MKRYVSKWTVDDKVQGYKKILEEYFGLEVRVLPDLHGTTNWFDFVFYSPSGMRIGSTGLGAKLQSKHGTCLPDTPEFAGLYEEDCLGGGSGMVMEYGVMRAFGVGGPIRERFTEEFGEPAFMVQVRDVVKARELEMKYDVPWETIINWCQERNINLCKLTKEFTTYRALMNAIRKNATYCFAKDGHKIA